MRFVSSAIKLILILVAGFISSCQATTQNSDAPSKNDPRRVLVRPPDGNYLPIEDIENRSVSPLLAGVWQYGLLAASAYAKDSNTLTGFCTYPSRYLSRWKRVPGYSEDRVFPLRPTGRLAIPGLSYSVWQDMKSTDHARLALTFKGTDVDEWGDLYSNARWITRLNPSTWDQYQQTRDLVTLIVPLLKMQFGPD